MTTQPNLLAALLTIRDASPPEAGLMAGVDTWSALVEELQKIAGDAVDAAGVRPDGDGLLPCPFCGATVSMSAEGVYHQVICQECGSKAAEYPNSALASLAWNTRATQPARDAAEGAGDENIPFAIWADRVERTTRLIKVQEADSYRSAIRMARIDCFYDFEAKRLVALLRSLAAPPKPAPDAMREDFTTKVAVTALLAARELIEANRLSADPADWFTSLRKLRDALAAPLPPADETSITINREALYRAISNHLPSDMIDAIWQEVIEALELKP